MIYKEVVDNQLFVYIIREGKASLLYKRWLNLGYGRIFCTPSFTCK